VRSSIAAINRRINFENSVGMEKPVNEQANILSRKSFVFDTYSQASNDMAKETGVKLEMCRITGVKCVSRCVP
jgi:hypothetical protein